MFLSLFLLFVLSLMFPNQKKIVQAMPLPLHPEGVLVDLAGNRILVGCPPDIGATFIPTHQGGSGKTCGCGSR